MCGISGAWRFEGLPGHIPHDAMRDALRHRGPDQQASHVITTPQGSPRAVLSATRLSIVDVDGGQQPVSSPDGAHWVAFNGEIYNHDTLRRRQDARGLTPRNRSDTALLAALLSVLPVENVLDSLQGMFAFATINTKTGQLVLARDRMGVKPLYTTQLPDGTLLWSSELKGLLMHPSVKRAVDVVSLHRYLMFEYIPSPRSIYQNIQKLPPGHMLIADEHGVRISPWWTPPAIRGSGSGGNQARWAQSVGRALRVAVHSRMQADVDVGYLLSGGLDSSAVVAAARHRNPTQPLHTFSMTVDAPGFDESTKARAVANALNTVHHEARLTPERFLAIAHQLAEEVDEPLADSSLVATRALMMEVAANGFRCVLSGDGADESFGGYPTYLAHQLASPATRFKQPLQSIVRRLPVRHNGVTPGYMARRFLDGLDAPWARRHQIWMGAWCPDEIGATDADWDIVDRISQQAEHAHSDAISRAMYLDQRLYLAEGVLVKVDRASMANGIEVRSPFLDYRMVELAADIPTHMKVRRRQTKIVLRQAVKDWLPASTLQAPKKGFGSPVGPWLRGACKHLLEKLPERTEGLIHSDRLRQCIAEHLSGQADHRRRLWSAVVLAMWREGRWGPG